MGWEDFGVKEGMEDIKKGGEWSEKFGDRNSEFVCIGVKLDKDKMLEALEGALLTDEEMAKGRESWKELEDPMFGGEKLWDLKDMLAFEAKNKDLTEEEGEEDDDEDEDENSNEANEASETSLKSSRTKQKIDESNETEEVEMKRRRLD